MLNTCIAPLCALWKTPPFASELCQGLVDAPHITGMASSTEVGLTTDCQSSKASPPRWQSFHPEGSTEIGNQLEPSANNECHATEPQEMPQGSHQEGPHLGEWEVPMVRLDPRAVMPQRLGTTGLQRHRHQPQVAASRTEPQQHGTPRAWEQK